MTLGGLKIAGLALLAVLAIAFAGFALTEPAAPPPVSEKVANYRAPTVSVAPAKTVAIIGDSYSAGVGAVDPAVANGWVGRLGLNQAWNIRNFSRSGTGYSTSVSERASQICGLDYCPKYSEMITDVAATNPTLVIVAGGRNDANVDPLSEAEAIRNFYTELRAKIPNAKVVGFNALWDDTNAPAAINEISTEVKAAVEAVGGTYLSVGQPLAGRPDLVSPDGIHPNPAGHAAIFDATVKALHTAQLAVR